MQFIVLSVVLYERGKSAPPPSSGLSDQQWAIALHLSGLLGLTACTTPGINVLGPLVIWLIKRPVSGYLDEVGKRVLNFQISYALYFFVLWVVSGILWMLLLGWLLFPLIGVGAILWVIFTVIGAVKESSGERYTFPMIIQFLK